MEAQLAEYDSLKRELTLKHEQTEQMLETMQKTQSEECARLTSSLDSLKQQLAVAAASQAEQTSKQAETSAALERMTSANAELEKRAGMAAAEHLTEAAAYRAQLDAQYMAKCSELVQAQAFAQERADECAQFKQELGVRGKQYEILEAECGQHKNRLVEIQLEHNRKLVEESQRLSLSFNKVS